MLEVQLATHLQAFHLEIQFTAPLGKTTVLLGESGSGKTTVLRALAGLHFPEQGRIILERTTYFDTTRHIAVPPQERPFGYVFQDYLLFPHLTVFENVAFGLRAQHLPRLEIRQRVGEALERVRMMAWEQRRPQQLSGGQQQRVAIARALALQPQLLLLDEPMAALDVQTRREVRQELRSILAETKLTTLLVTHQYLEALIFGEQVLVLDNGHLIQQGTQNDLLTTPRSAYIAELVGMNFFMGQISGYDSGRICHIRVNSTPLEIVATLREQMEYEDIAPLGTDVSVVVAPQSITLSSEHSETSARNNFRGTITQLLHLGSGDAGRIRVSIALGPALPSLTAEITTGSVAAMQLREGGTVYASFKATEASAYR